MVVLEGKLDRIGRGQVFLPLLAQKLDRLLVAVLRPDVHSEFALSVRDNHASGDGGLFQRFPDECNNLRMNKDTRFKNKPNAASTHQQCVCRSLAA
jgi:hypothetical protein